MSRIAARRRSALGALTVLAFCAGTSVLAHADIPGGGPNDATGSSTAIVDLAADVDTGSDSQLDSDGDGPSLGLDEEIVEPQSGHELAGVEEEEEEDSERATDEAVEPFDLEDVDVSTVPDVASERSLLTLAGAIRFPNATPLARGVSRVGGSDRYATSVAMSKRLFPGSSKAKAVFIASGRSYSDGLTMGALASFAGGPLLLVRPGSLNPSVAAEIRRLQPEEIYVAGGDGAVSDFVFAALESLAPHVERLAGANRYLTAEAIATKFPVGSGAMLATGTTFPDALVASAASVKNGGGGPVLLTRGFTASEEAIRALRSLRPSAVTIVGGTWSSAALDAIKNAGGTKPQTLSGKDRFATSAAVAAKFWPETSTRIIFANGTNYPDALVSVPASAAYNAPIVLIRSNCKPEVVSSVTSRQTYVLMAGGNGVLSADAYYKVCPVLPSVVSQSGGFYRFNMTHRNQQTNYYCGPATAQMILSRIGYARSASGMALSQSNLAKTQYLATDAWGRTAWVNSAMSKGLNAWMGKNVYVQRAAPGVTAFRSAVNTSFTKTGRPVVVDAQEWAGGRHYNGHPSYTTFSHLMPVEGYSPSSDAIIMLDPAEHYYAASRPSFTHNLPAFAGFLNEFGIYY